MTNEAVDIVADIYAEVDRLDPEAYANCFTPDGKLTFGNADTIIGREAITEAFRPTLALLESMRHEVVDAWRQDDRIVAQLTVNYVLKNGRRLALPAVTISRLEGDLIAENQTYIDMGPIFAAD